MECPGATRSVLTRALQAKRELHCYFSGKGDHYYIQTRSFFPLQFFYRKLKEKSARKARVNTERVYRIVLMPPEHPMILLKSN